MWMSMIPMYWSYNRPLLLNSGNVNLPMSIEPSIGIGVLR